MSDPVIEFFDDSPKKEDKVVEKKAVKKEAVKSVESKPASSEGKEFVLKLPGSVWVYASILLVFLIGFSVFTHGFKDITGFFAAKTGNSTSNSTVLQDSIVLTLLYDSSCEQCYDPTLHGQVLAGNGVKVNSTTRIVDVNTPEGADLVSKYNIDSVPTFLAPPELAKNYPSLITQFLSQFGSVESDGWYVFRNNDAVGQPYRDLVTGEIKGLPPNPEQLAAGGHSIGNESAPITIVEFSDFQCPYCELWYSNVSKSLKSEYVDAGKVRFVYRQFPLSFHANALNASLASECSSEQDKFWEYYDLLFTHQSALSSSDLKKYASDLGLNSSQFNSCFESQKYLPIVEADMSAAQSAGVGGTPTVFINGVQASGYDFNVYKQYIDSLLAG